MIIQSLYLFLMLVWSSHARKMVLVGGESDNSSYEQSAVMFDFETQNWKHVADMPAGRVALAVASLNGLVYATGGRNGSYQQTVFVFDPTGNKWVVSKDMVEERAAHAIVEMQGKLFAVGGYNRETSSLGTVEAYDPQKNQWSLFGSGMSIKRFYLAVGVLTNLYAVGGANGSNGAGMDSAEQMNPKTGVWSNIASMNVPRYGHCVATLGGKLYAIGGTNGEGGSLNFLKSAEVYDPKKDRWSPISDMKVAKNGAGCVVHNGEIYVVGGTNRTTYHDILEVYNPSKNIWRTMNQRLSIARCCAGLAYL